MLDPYFFRCPPELGFNLNAPDLKFQIIGYSQVADFTLVSWEFGSQQEYFSGEALYKNKELLLCGGGTLPLPTHSISENYQTLAPWERVSPTLWESGLNQNIATQLRSPDNYRDFQV